MTTPEGSDTAQRLRRVVAESRRLSAGRVGVDGISPAEAALAAWQCRRLAATYADFHGKVRYRPALDFFLSDIYGPKDFSRRDDDILRVYPVMVKLLSEPAIASLTEALELHALSMVLDAKLLEVMDEELGIDASQGLDDLTPDRYSEAYRRCDNYTDRLRQIELAVNAGQMLDIAARKRLLFTTVRLARKPAQVAGFGELQDFIERGLAAFRAMKPADAFIEALQQRELYILESIFRGAPASEWFGDASRLALAGA